MARLDLNQGAHVERWKLNPLARNMYGRRLGGDPRLHYCMFFRIGLGKRHPSRLEHRQQLIQRKRRRNGPHWRREGRDQSALLWNWCRWRGDVRGGLRGHVVRPDDGDRGGRGGLRGRFNHRHGLLLIRIVIACARCFGLGTRRTWFTSSTATATSAPPAALFTLRL